LRRSRRRLREQLFELVGEEQDRRRELAKLLADGLRRVGCERLPDPFGARLAQRQALLGQGPIERARRAAGRDRPAA
jgi:hypothetical protein